MLGTVVKYCFGIVVLVDAGGAMSVRQLVSHESKQASKLALEQAVKQASKKAGKRARKQPVKQAIEQTVHQVEIVFVGVDMVVYVAQRMLNFNVDLDCSACNGNVSCTDGGESMRLLYAIRG